MSGEDTSAASPASASPAAPDAAALSAASAKAVDAAKRRFATHMDQELLDYKHNHPTVIEACANLLIKIFNNILDHPDEEKYRQVKATSNAFKAVTNARGGEHLLIHAGFVSRVVDLQKYWAFEVDSHGIKLRVLAQCSAVLQRALGTIHEKAERERHRKEDAHAAEAARREAVRVAMEDDRATRKVREEALAAAAAAHATAPATPLPPAAGT